MMNIVFLEVTDSIFEKMPSFQPWIIIVFTVIFFQIRVVLYEKSSQFIVNTSPFSWNMYHISIYLSSALCVLPISWQTIKKTCTKGAIFNKINFCCFVNILKWNWLFFLVCFLILLQVHDSKKIQWLHVQGMSLLYYYFSCWDASSFTQFHMIRANDNTAKQENNILVLLWI